MILLSIYIYNWIGNKFLQLTSPSPYKYINSINKTNLTIYLMGALDLWLFLFVFLTLQCEVVTMMTVFVKSLH